MLRRDKMKNEHICENCEVHKEIVNRVTDVIPDEEILYDVAELF